MKKLYKSRKNKVIAGVCGGIAEHFDVDPVLIRLIAVLFTFTGGAAVIAYIIGMIIIPDQPLEPIKIDGEIPPAPETTPPVRKEDFGRTGSLIVGLILIVFGVHFLLRHIPFFNNYYWWFWDMGWHYFWPSILIAIGLLIILRSVRK